MKTVSFTYAGRRYHLRLQDRSLWYGNIQVDTFDPNRASQPGTLHAAAQATLAHRKLSLPKPQLRLVKA